MATPFPNAYGGFTEGLLGGFNTMNSALAQKRQLDMQRQQMDASNESKTLEDALKGLTANVELAKIKHSSIRDTAMSNIQQILANPIVTKRLGIDPTKIPTKLQWNDSLQPFIDETSNLIKAYNDPKSPLYQQHDEFTKALTGTLNKAGTALDEEQQKTLGTYIKQGSENAVKQGEQRNFMDAARVGLLPQTDPAQMAAINALNASNPSLMPLTGRQAVNETQLGLLGQSGKSGEEVIKKRIEEANQTEEQLTARALNGDTEAQSILNRIQKRKIELAEATGKARADATGKDFRQESSMRKEFLDLPEVKQYPVIEQQAGRALKALSDPYKNKVAVDQSIITTFNKMLDPSSVVRESEYARTPQDMALLNRIKGKWDKLSTGGAGITDDERQAMSRMIKAFKSVADDQYNEQVKYYTGLSKRYGYKPENVVRLGGKIQSAISSAETRPPLSSFGGK